MAAACIAIAGAAQATTDAGSMPRTESEFITMASDGLLTPQTQVQFSNGRTLFFGGASDPAFASSALGSSRLTSDPPLTSGGGVGPQVGLPEPATWMMLIAGFGLVGLVARRRKTSVTA
jgi:hypothetical protein